MVLFKEKKNKTHKVETRVTLDAKHNSKLKQFRVGMKSVKKLRARQKSLQGKYDKLKNRSNCDLTDEELERKLQLRELLTELSEKIQALECNAEMNTYLLDTSYLLFSYYNDDEVVKPTKKKKKTLIKKNLSVVDFFTKNVAQADVSSPAAASHKVGEETTKKKAGAKMQSTMLEDVTSNGEEGTSASSSSSGPSTRSDGSGSPSVQQKDSLTPASASAPAQSEFKKFTKNEIINNYMCLTDERYINNIEYLNEDIDYCLDCNLEKIYYPSEGIIVCPCCARQEKILLDSDKPSYKEPPREISYFAYKRINHFNEWLAQFQAKESTDIPKSVYDKIKAEIKKESYLNKSNLKINKIREILNKINLSKYYEHVPHIINRLSGNPAPIISRETEDKLRMMFKEIQAPWIRFCPNNRSNFLSYSYVLYKFLQLLEFDEYLDYFNLLKSREKLAEADKIWKLICHDLKWQFIKTIWRRGIQRVLLSRHQSVVEAF